MFNVFKREHYNLNQIELSKNNLLANYDYLSSLDKNIRIAPVLKSNAYGHGLVLIAKALDTVGAPFFCVDSLHEAYELYKANIQTAILIMGYIDPRNLQTKKLPFSYAVFDKKMLFAIKKYQPHAGIHLFVDTGMHREGINLEDLNEFIALTKDYSLTIEGVMSHLALAHKPNDENTKLQIANFQKVLHILEEQNIKPKWKHIAASDGLLQYKKYKNKLGNISRCGIALYGINETDTKLQPILQFTSKIAQIKQIKKGEKVGYDFTFSAKNNITIAILPIGFNDGVEKKLSNQGFVLIQNIPCKIIGRVSMNITVIDITHISKVGVGDTVIVYSNTLEQHTSINKATKLANVTPYELLIHLDSSIKRNLKA